LIPSAFCTKPNEPNKSHFEILDPQDHFHTPQPEKLSANTAIMARGEAPQTKCHYKGKDEDFVVFVEDAKSAKDWKTDKSIPLAQVVGSFKIFVTHKYVMFFTPHLYILNCGVHPYVPFSHFHQQA
jgi:hypothetical protein